MENQAPPTVLDIDQSPESGAVGRRLGQLFHLDTAPSFRTRSLRTGYLAATEIRAADPVLEVSAAVPVEDSYLLTMLIKDMNDHEIWEDGKPFPRRTAKAGEFMLRDLNRSQAVRIDQPHHSIHIHLPRSALDDIADQAGARHIDTIPYTPGVAFLDPTLVHLVESIRPALELPGQVNNLLLEHVLIAIGTHVAATYGGMTARSNTATGGLARRQERRAKEMLQADLQGRTSLQQLAGESGLSVSHFSRAFKASTGFSPHQWLILQRVQEAKRLLANPNASIADVALACGFSDQSHLTRVFAQHTGATPAAWRQQV